MFAFLFYAFIGTLLLMGIAGMWGAILGIIDRIRGIHRDI